jgi:malonyl-CoA/methylmalonyl-CoA synthetase
MSQPIKHIHQYLETNAEKYPDELALVQDDDQFTWQELHTRVTDAAAALSRQLTPSDEQQVVGLLLPNSWEFIVSYLAILRTGHIALPLDPNYKKLEIDGIMEQIVPAVVITDVEHAPLFDEPLLAEELVTVVVEPNIDAFVKLDANEQVASLLFTSGTTGKPKITQYTHANHMWNITAVSDLWEWTHQDTLLLSLPLSHWHGLVMGLDGALYHGNTMYLHERFDAERTLEILSSGAISLFMHVPIAYSRMIHVDKPERYSLDRVRLCVSGSSYLPPAIWHEFKRLYNQEILERYGASEMGLLVSNPLDDRKPGSVGMRLPDVTIRVTESGELAMKSPGLFPGYYKNEEATKKNITDDGLWLTGDIGTFDDDGRLVLHGRVIEKIKKHGYTVYPRDVEWAVHKMNGIVDIVVIGVQDESNLSDTLVYFVVGSATEEEIQAHAKANMPSAWRPDKIIYLEDVPKTRSGKPIRRELLEMAEKSLKK